MAYAGLKATVSGLIQRINELTTQRMIISNQQTDKMRQSANLSKDYADAKNVIRGMYDADSTAYEVAMSEVEEEYEYNSAKIASWESELDQQASQIEEECKAAKEMKESYQSMLKSNIKEDHKLIK